ncbi:MBL fold metallo-hydrolase [Thermodesulfobacteriota bacterium]
MIEIEEIDGIKIFRLSRSILGRTLYFTACFWVDGLMVDTGCFYTERDLVCALNGLKVDFIVNTHSHEDHVGANAAIKKIHGADIFAHAKALPQLENPLHNGPLRPYQKIMWGNPTPSIGSEIGKMIQTDHHSFEVIYSPGHSVDHISLYEPNMGWLFTGDTYIGGLDRALRHDYNIWQIISSLKKLVQLETRLLFPGSGNVRRDPKAEICKKIKYLEEVGEKVISLHSKGCSLRQIRKTLFGNETFIAYFTLGHFSGKNLVRSYIVNQTH